MLLLFFMLFIIMELVLMFYYVQYTQHGLASSASSINQLIALDEADVYVCKAVLVSVRVHRDR